MGVKQWVLGTFVSAVLLTVLTLSALPLYAQSGSRPLTPQQQQLVVEKARARAAAGVVQPLVGPAQTTAQAGAPSRPVPGVVETTKSELIARLNQSIARDRPYLERLAREGQAELAQRERESYEEQRRLINVMPDGPVSLAVPGVRTGSHSIYTARATWDCCIEKDPVNVIFYRNGAPWDVEYALSTWPIAGRKWKFTDCGSSQWMYFWDAQHQGQDGWKMEDSQLEPETQPPNSCLAARDHTRVFGSFVMDNHPNGFLNYSVADAHHDATGHLFTDDWEGPEYRTRLSCYDENWNTMWFCGAIWFGNYSNAGQWQQAWNDGMASFIELRW